MDVMVRGSWRALLSLCWRLPVTSSPQPATPDALSAPVNEIQTLADGAPELPAGKTSMQMLNVRLKVFAHGVQNDQNVKKYGVSIYTKCK